MRGWGVALLALALPGAVARGITEDGYEERMRAEVLPYFASSAIGSFEGQAGVRIACAALEVPCERGALVVLPGKSESLLKYAELAFDLRECGYSLFLMDHRGMGISGPLPRDDPGKTDVDRFDDYVADLERFVDQVVDARPHPRRVLLAHSMGGAIALLYLERHPGRFDGAILCAPMLRIDTEPLPAPVARAMGEVAVWLGLGGCYCPGRGPYAREPFERNVFTRSHVRWSRWEEEIIPSHSLCGLGGPTLRWLREGMAAGDAARRDAERVAIPVLLLQAGRDGMVRNDGQDEACAKMRDCALLRFPEARHEILMERDAIRDEAVARILDFLDRVAAGADTGSEGTSTGR